MITEEPTRIATSPLFNKSVLLRQVGKVQNRLFLLQLLNNLINCWIAALLVTIGLILIYPVLVPLGGGDHRFAIALGLLAAGSLACLGLAVAFYPNPVKSALDLDVSFGLNERVTTGLMLTPEECVTPAGQALLEDINHRVGSLKLSEQFPFSVQWKIVLIPLLLIGLGILSVYIPAHYVRRSPGQSDPVQAALSEEMKEKIKEKLQLKKSADKKTPETQKSPELAKLEGQQQQLISSKLENREDALDLVKNMSSLEEQMQKRDQQLAQRSEALQQQLKQIQRLSQNRQPLDGPASKLNRAIEKGDFRQADREGRELAKLLASQQKIEDAIEKIQNQLKEGNLTAEEKQKLEKTLENLKKQQITREQKKQLGEQLKDLQKKIDQLARDPKERARELKEMAEKGLIDEQQLQEELAQLKEQMDQLDPKMVKNLSEVADKLRQALKAMEKGDEADGARLLEEAVDLLAQCDPGAERDELKQQLQQLLDSRRMIADGLENNEGGQGSGRRPDGKPHDTRSEEQRVRSELDKGALQIVDTVPGQGFKGPRSPAELSEEIRQATQAAPEGIDRQRLPRSASEMARGYFEKLRIQEKK